MDGGISAWVPVIAVLAGSGVTGIIQYFINRQNHDFALAREEKAAAERQRHERQMSEEKLARERYLIVTELVFMLERFAAECADTAIDSLDRSSARKASPSINLDSVQGDWRVLTIHELYRLHELPVIRAQAEAVISHTWENDAGDYRDTEECRRYQYARLGLYCSITARRLRINYGLPAARHETDSSSVWRILWRTRRRLWSKHVILEQQSGVL